MAKIFEATANYDGTFDVAYHQGKKMLVTTRDNGRFDADTVGDALDGAIAASVKHKAGFDKWSFYVEGESEKLAQTEKTIPAATIQKALKDGYAVTLETGRYWKPRVSLRPKNSGKKKASTKSKLVLI